MRVSPVVNMVFKVILTPEGPALIERQDGTDGMSAVSIYALANLRGRRCWAWRQSKRETSSAALAHFGADDWQVEVPAPSLRAV